MSAFGGQAFPLPRPAAAGNPLTRCEECRGLRAELEVARLDARRAAAQLAAAGARADQLALDLEAERTANGRLRDELLAPRDVTVTILRERLAVCEQRLELARARHRHEQALEGDGAPPPPPPDPGADKRDPYPLVPVRRAGYPMQITEVGYAEALFVQYADSVDMAPGARAGWLTGGRVSPRFHLLCVQALAADVEWRRLHLAPPDGGDALDYFFWKMAALGLDLDLVVTVDSYVTGKMGLGGGKSHVSRLQLRQGVENYHLQRTQFFASYESALSHYLLHYTGWAPAAEYGKTVPAHIFAVQAPPHTRAGREAARALAEAARQGSILVDAGREQQHLFLGADAVLPAPPPQVKRRKPAAEEGPLTTRRRQDEELRDSAWF